VDDGVAEDFAEHQFDGEMLGARQEAKDTGPEAQQKLLHGGKCGRQFYVKLANAT
jgi:hypothetical protein